MTENTYIHHTHNCFYVLKYLLMLLWLISPSSSLAFQLSSPNLHVIITVTITTTIITTTATTTILPLIFYSYRSKFLKFTIVLGISFNFCFCWHVCLWHWYKNFVVWLKDVLSVDSKNWCDESLQWCLILALKHWPHNSYSVTISLSTNRCNLS